MPASQTRGLPGTRAPHVALGPDRSTLDLFGRSFVLLRATADDWAPPGVEAHVITADGFLDAYGITREGAVLVRPDGIVGWRSTGAFTHDDVTSALHSILARTGSGE
jgi:putative polyketide hydroxylase